jgi:hypothetical protein
MAYLCEKPYILYSCRAFCTLCARTRIADRSYQFSRYYFFKRIAFKRFSHGLGCFINAERNPIFQISNLGMITDNAGMHFEKWGILLKRRKNIQQCYL